MDFYSRLNYSLGNEDWRVEEQALRVNKGDSVICVTASGDRPLHLLMTECTSVLSIDMNPIQNYLLELKKAALSVLDYEEYLDFLGGTPCSHRYEIFKKIKNLLSEKSYAHWEKNKKLIKAGIIYQGRIEKITHLGAIFIKIFRRKAIKTLLSFENIEEQRAYVATKWDTRVWRKFFDVILNPNFMRTIFNDPGMMSYIDTEIKPGRYIYGRMLQYLNNDLAKKSALIQLILNGRILSSAYFPYMTYEGYRKIRANLHKLNLLTGNIIDHLETLKSHQYDIFSLSDIASYMSQSNFEKLLHGMLKVATHDARFCIRKLMSNHFIPEPLLPHFQREFHLEKKLELEERNFVYRFMIGNIFKDVACP